MLIHFDIKILHIVSAKLVMFVLHVLNVQVAFEIMNIMAVISNTAIIAVSPKGQELKDIYGDVTFILVLVVIEVRLLCFLLV